MKTSIAMAKKALVLMGLVWAGGWAGAGAVAQAGVFNVPHFIQPGESAIGLEPELVLTHGAGLGANLRFQHGLTDLNNLTVILGNGGGPRQFRVGGNVTFDFFPDIKGQPGIGIAAQTIYYRTGGDLGDQGLLEITGIPYVHKAFRSESLDFEPFLAVPLGAAFYSGNYKGISQVVLGSLFKANEHIRYVAEMGVNINNSETYFSGGIIYYF